METKNINIINFDIFYIFHQIIDEKFAHYKNWDGLLRQMAGRLVQSVFLIYFPLGLQVFQKPKLLAGDHQVFRVKLIGFLHTNSQKSPKRLKVVFISGYIHFGQN